MQPRRAAVLALALALPAALACQLDDPPDTSGAAYAVIVEAEVRVDRPVLGGTGAVSDSADVAWSGSQYLAVWRQDTQESTSDSTVRAARIAPDGTILDPGSILISGDAAYPENHAVTFFDGDYLVAYQGPGDIHVTRVGLDGDLAAVGTVEGGGTLADVAAGANEAMIVLSRFEGVWVARYDGTRIATPVVIGYSEFGTRPRIARGPGGDYLVVWESRLENIRGRFLSPAGVPGAEVVISEETVAESNPAVASTGSGYAVVWQQESGVARIRARRVSPTGALGPATDVSSGSFTGLDPSVSCAAICMILWTGGPDDPTLDLRGRRFDPPTGQLGLEQIVAGGQGRQGPAELAGAGGQRYLVWADRLSGIVEAYGATATDAGFGLLLGPRHLLARGRNIEELPAVTASNDSWLVAWSDSRNGGFDVFGKRFGFDGVAETELAVPIHQGPNLQRVIALGWNGGRFLAAWRNGRSQGAAAAARLTANGDPIDSAPIALRTGRAVDDVHVAGGSGDWLVGWSRIDGPPPANRYRSILTSIVRDDGTSTEPRLVATNSEDTLGVARDLASGVYVVAWIEGAELRARRVATDGTFIDATPVTVATGVSSSYLVMAAGAGVVLLAWIDRSNDNLIHGARVRVGASGIEPLDDAPLPLVADPADRRRLAITFVAQSFLIAYESRSFQSSEYDIWGAQVAPSGAVADGPFLLVGSAHHEGSPALSGVSQGRALLAYTRRPPGRLTRVYVRRLIVSPP